MEGVSVDTHICIRCSETIVGIDAYLEHRKRDCFAAMPQPVEEPPIPPEDPVPPDFFLSLDLQRIIPISSHDVNADSSGSESEDPMKPPRNHTGGKWRPGSRPSIMQSMQHYRDRTPSPERLPDHSEKMGCAPCGRIFRDKYTYQRHLESSLHRKRSLQNASRLAAATETETNKPRSRISQRVRLTKTMDATETEETPRAAKTSRCPICYKWYSSKLQMENHRVLKHKSRCELCSFEAKNDQELRDHLKVHKRHWVCCGRKFTTKKGIREHKESFHQAIIELQECVECCEKFRTTRALRDHKCQSNSVPLDLRCEHCEFQTSSRKNLDLHERTHSKEKPYACDKCDYKAARHGQLWRHRKQHEENVHKFKCPYCEFTCTLIENLRNHIKKSAKHRGLDVYPCKKCSFSTDCSKESKLHALSHL